MSIKIEFSETENNLFVNMYMAFCGSQKTPKTTQEIDRALNVLHAMKGMSIPPDQSDALAVQRGMRFLKDTGGVLELDEEELEYLLTSVSPPHALWPHSGLEMFVELRDKLSNTKLKPVKAEA